jgi:hypothetical protein
MVDLEAGGSIVAVMVGDWRVLLISVTKGGTLGMLDDG